MTEQLCLVCLRSLVFRHGDFKSIDCLFGSNVDKKEFECSWPLGPNKWAPPVELARDSSRVTRPVHQRPPTRHQKNSCPHHPRKHSFPPWRHWDANTVIAPVPAPAAAYSPGPAGSGTQRCAAGSRTGHPRTGPAARGHITRSALPCQDRTLEHHHHISRHLVNYDGLLTADNSPSHSVTPAATPKHAKSKSHSSRI